MTVIQNGLNNSLHQVQHHLREIFALFGLPETVITDNSTCFISEEFKGFLKANSIQLFTSAPYHPTSNDLAERAVRRIKRGLRKKSNGIIHSRGLFSHCISPQHTTGISPAELLLGGKVKSRLDLFLPDVREWREYKKLRKRIMIKYQAERF